MRRFYLRDRPVSGIAHLDGDEAHHVRNVLRLNSGDDITLFDGSGGEYVGRIQLIGRKDVTLQIISQSHRDPALPVHLIVACSIVKHRAMDLLVQKCTELGAAELWPCVTQRTSVKVPLADLGKHMKWQRASIEAAKQCGRNTLLTIRPPMSFEELLAFSKDEQLKVMLSVSETVVSLRDVIGRQMPDRLVVLIGPEGGLSEDEQRLANSSGFVSASMGPFVLRTETAALAAAAAVLFHCG